MWQNKSRPRIAFLTEADPLDKRSWSSSLYYIGQSLQQHCGEVSYVGPFVHPEPSLLSKVRAKSSLMLFKRRYLHETNMHDARTFGMLAAEKLAALSPDLIVSAASQTVLAFLETAIPIVWVSDTNFLQLMTYYSGYSHLTRRSRHEVRIIEQRALEKIHTFVLTSAWGARSVIEDYHADPQHVYIVPFGANLDTIPSKTVAENRKLSGRCTLLFMGVEWQRKGGDIALATLVELEKLGIAAELIVCGCVPPTHIAHPCMTEIPFLDKNDPLQQQQLEQLFITSDFLLLPTRADGAPNVFREASAFGLPVITTNTGGVSSIIRDGENGYMLPLAARGREYADLISNIYRDEEHYQRLALSSRAEYEERLNWDSWGQSVSRILQSELGVKQEVGVEV